MLTGHHSPACRGFIWNSLYTCWNKAAFYTLIGPDVFNCCEVKDLQEPCPWWCTRLSFCLSLKVGNCLPFLCAHLPKISQQTLAKISVAFLGAVSVRFKAHSLLWALSVESTRKPEKPF